MSEPTFKESAIRTITMERDAVSQLLDRIDDSFEKACTLMLKCEGRVVVTGMGKSGHIATKIAATLASTGTPAMFVHPAEASHGDLGMITSKDVVLALSNSGNVTEIITLIPLFKRMRAPLISMSGNHDSLLSQAADVHLDVSVLEEACPLDLAPTSSTTVSLVMGDALAMALLEARGFTAEDFAFSHPGGSLGKKLLLKTADVMHKGSQIPIVSPETKLSDALLEVTTKKLGMTTVVDDANTLIGIFTDGDLRRALDQNIDIRTALIKDVMTINCKTISPDMLAAQALAIMDEAKISVLAVVDSENRPIGALHIHDLLEAGIA
ncbi:MAG: arabinose-5-phosphate isomerase [Gammaproteobacteria bacterium]|jgi:arabinose-5-phosphate isomerase